jgi:hypothetical protein
MRGAVNNFRNRLGYWATVLTTAVVAVAFSFNGASAASIKNVLVNGGFEKAGSYGSMDLGPGWSYIQTQFTFGTDHLTVNPKGTKCYSGKKCAYIAAGEGENKTGSIIQTIKLAPGTYDFTLSGWSWQYESDTSDNNSWTRGDLYTEPSDHIVGDPGFFGGVGYDAKYGSCNGTCWTHLTNTFNNVAVNGSVTLVVTQRVNGYGTTGHGSAMTDDWLLKATKVK